MGSRSSATSSQSGDVVIEVLARYDVELRNEDDVILGRRRVRELAQARGFDSFAIAAITTVTSELARNVEVHGGGGKLVIEELRDGDRVGFRLGFIDDGPGIADIPRAMSGGNSTVRTLGLGLSGSKRLVDQFELVSAPGKGTTVTVTKWKRF